MKKQIIFPILLALTFYGGSLYSQPIYNGDFEEFSFNAIPCAPNKKADNSGEFAPFQMPGCNFKGSWYASHGTPEIHQTALNDHMLCMWARGGNNLSSEGVFMSCYFEKGKYYDLSFNANTYTKKVSELRIVLVQEGQLIPKDLNSTMLDPGFSISDYQVPTLTSEQVIASITDIPAPNNSKTFSVVFSPTSDGYQYILIYPIADVDARQYIYLDDFEFKECSEFIEYENTSEVPLFTMMQQYIVARNDINLNDNLAYTFSAGNFISLEPNFEVGLGTTFETNLSACSFESFRCEGNDYYGYKDLKFEQKLVEIYPNPASAQAYVKNLKLGDVITITDKFGNLMLKQLCENEAEDCKIELSNFNTGWHFVLVYRNNELINYEKLLVE